MRHCGHTGAEPRPGRKRNVGTSGLRLRAFLAGLCILAAAASAQEAKPPAALLLPEAALPEYERDLDHAGLIRGWGKPSLERGEKTYALVCHSCHGDLNLRGSLPDALAFGAGTFQHGNDPLRMYQTVTRGWRMMPPQTQLTPREKYDVIHYIRETFVAPHNRAQLFDVTEAYLASLPTGAQRGPAPVLREPWRDMDYGRFLIGTFEVADAANRAAAAQVPAGKRDVVPPEANIAYKGIGIRLDPGAGGVAAGRTWVVFEHDTLRLAGGWSGAGFIDWEGINFNGRHVVRPRTVGAPIFEVPDGPGWADPATNRFDDARVVGLDGRKFGPLPRAHARYRGLYRHAERTVVSYEIGGVAVLESHALEALGDEPVVVRTLNVARSARELRFRVARSGPAVALAGLPREALEDEAGEYTVRIRSQDTPARLAVRIARSGVRVEELEALAKVKTVAELGEFTRGSAAEWKETISAPVVQGDGRDGLTWARLTLPQSNPWRARLRLTGVEFLADSNSAVVCTWDGDVWRVDGLADEAEIRWRRIASGLFQPLGIKRRGEELFVTCRDQLVRLRDLNGDGETDFYESINSDHQVTEHFHEFAMGLQTDAAGNFYYAKSARHARTPLVPQHGTLLKVSADGTRTDILANGFRAANGVCLNDDGSFFVTDQEGHWMPMNRINRVVPGRFYGNMWSHGAPADSSDGAMARPLCWIDKAFDRSPGELVRVEGARWGELRGALLNLSYGRGRIEVVLQDGAGESSQGAVCALPLPDFPTGIMRGRFHPGSGDLYVCGLSAWATSQTQQEGALYRLRRTSAPVNMPTGWHVRRDGVDITFSEPVDPLAAADVGCYRFARWDLKRSANYGSPRIDERTLPVTRAEVLADGRTLRLTIPDLGPADIVELSCRLVDGGGRRFERVIQGTIHFLNEK